jgi:site-specific DNA-cytosine methylase
MIALEFFSGIGGFAQAARQLGIDIVAAFDQDAAANQIYEINYGLTPNCRNLDSIRPEEIPAADLWWMSPPCAPYTVRGAQRDDKDRRARSMLNLLSVAARLKPKFLVVENVLGFAQSSVLKKFKQELQNEGYGFLEIFLCPTRFGIPARRPRLFVCAMPEELSGIAATYEQGRADISPTRPLVDFLISQPGEALIVDETDRKRYDPVLNIIDPIEPGQQAICFTSGYGRCWKASGSLVRMKDGRVRRFAPAEILKLLGFTEDFRMPENLSLTKQWRLVGNSLDVRCVVHVVALIHQLGEWQKVK